VLRATGAQLRLEYGPTGPAFENNGLGATFKVDNQGNLAISAAGGKFALGTQSAPTRTLNLFDSVQPRLLLSTAASGLYSGLQLELIGSTGYLRNLTGGAIEISNLLKLDATATEPATPIAGWVYLDDGTNTADGKPHLRHYDGTAWNQL